MTRNSASPEIQYLQSYGLDNDTIIKRVARRGVHFRGMRVAARDGSRDACLCGGWLGCDLASEDAVGRCTPNQGGSYDISRNHGDMARWTRDVRLVDYDVRLTTTTETKRERNKLYRT